jgi:hypothetical protein
MPAPAIVTSDMHESGGTYGVAAAAAEARDVGRLLRFGLARHLDRAELAELRELVQAHGASERFRAVMRATAAGLGLVVVEVDVRGVVLVPMEHSPFAMAPGALRNYASADDRLLDGLIMVSIAATVYPRPETLDEDRTIARLPITVADVEQTLRDLCDRLAAEPEGSSDPAASDAKAGLLEAWRVYAKRPAVRKTPDDRKASRTTTRLIEGTLELLREHSCFVKTARAGGTEAYQPTWRYQVQMQDFAVSELYDVVTALLAAPAATPPATRGSDAESAVVPLRPEAP